VTPRLLWLENPGIPNGAFCTYRAAHRSEVFIRYLKSDLPHRRIGRDRCYKRSPQSLIVRRCGLPPCPRRERPKLTLDKSVGVTANVPGDLRDTFLLECVADIHREIFKCRRIGFRL